MAQTSPRASVRAPAPTRNLDQLRADIAECGYGILADALAPPLLADLKHRVLEQAAGEREAGIAHVFGDDTTGMPGARRKGGDTAPNQRLSNLLNKGPVFRALLHHPVVEAGLSVMLGQRHLLSSLSAMIMRKGGVAQVLHTDQQFVPFRTPVAMVANILWMMVDFTAANGATRVVPGSHLWDPPDVRIDRNEAGEEILIQPDTETIAAEAPAGSALVFDGRLWHGAGANTTDTPRPAIFSYYCQPYLRQQENIPMSISDAVYRDLSEVERAMVGFEAYRRGMGRIAPALGRVNTNWTDYAAGVLTPAHPAA